MKFKLLHVRPHVWFFKQKETISKATSDDSSSEGPYVYKRSTSLKLVKSDPSLGIAKRNSNPLDASKPSSNTALRSQNQGKDVRVCTVVDAGCTCRATVSSQHKQKKGMGMLPNAKGELVSLHDVCRPRWAQVYEARQDVGSKHDVCRPRGGQLYPKRAASSNVSLPLDRSSSMVSRLVCKSSQDVVKHSQLNVEHCDVVCKSTHDEGKQFDARPSYGGDMVGGLDVHQLECRLRNAGLEERRRSSKKKNKYYEERPSISSGISSSNSTNTNTDSLITGTTTEMQDMLLNANPAFDTDVASMGDSMLSLEDLRASIAQRKLANQTSPCGKDTAPMDGMRENVAFTCSPSSLGSENVQVACRVSPPCVRNFVGHPCKEVNVRHVDVGVNKKLCFSDYSDLSNQGLVKQSQKASSNTYSTHKEAVQDNSKLLRRASRRIELGVQKGLDAQYGAGKSIVNRVNTGLSKGEVHEAKREVFEAQKKMHEADSESELGFVVLEGPVCIGANDDIGQEKQVVSSSSCEIQVLSDYSYDHHRDANHTYPMIRMHVNGTSPPGAVAHGQGATRSLEAAVGTSIMSTHAATAASHGVHTLEANSLGHELMRSDSAVAMVKSSYDPKRDFKESMLEMVVAKRLRAPRQLQQLLQCYLSLNPSHYHPTIIKVFHELCSELFN